MSASFISTTMRRDNELIIRVGGDDESSISTILSSIFSASESDDLDAPFSTAQEVRSLELDNGPDETTADGNYQTLVPSKASAPKAKKASKKKARKTTTKTTVQPTKNASTNGQHFNDAKCRKVKGLHKDKNKKHKEKEKTREQRSKEKSGESRKLSESLSAESAGSSFSASSLKRVKNRTLTTKPRARVSEDYTVRALNKIAERSAARGLIEEEEPTSAFSFWGVSSLASEAQTAFSSPSAMTAKRLGRQRQLITLQLKQKIEETRRTKNECMNELLRWAALLMRNNAEADSGIDEEVEVSLGNDGSDVIIDERQEADSLRDLAEESRRHPEDQSPKPRSKKQSQFFRDLTMTTTVRIQTGSVDENESSEDGVQLTDPSKTDSEDNNLLIVERYGVESETNILEQRESAFRKYETKRKSLSEKPISKQTSQKTRLKKDQCMMELRKWAKDAQENQEFWLSYDGHRRRLPTVHEEDESIDDLGDVQVDVHATAIQRAVRKHVAHSRYLRLLEAVSCIQRLIRNWREVKVKKQIQRAFFHEKFKLAAGKKSISETLARRRLEMEQKKAMELEEEHAQTRRLHQVAGRKSIKETLARLKKQLEQKKVLELLEEQEQLQLLQQKEFHQKQEEEKETNQTHREENASLDEKSKVPEDESLLPEGNQSTGASSVLNMWGLHNLFKFTERFASAIQTSVVPPDEKAGGTSDKMTSIASEIRELRRAYVLELLEKGEFGVAIRVPQDFSSMGNTTFDHLSSSFEGTAKGYYSESTFTESQAISSFALTSRDSTSACRTSDSEDEASSIEYGSSYDSDMESSIEDASEPEPPITSFEVQSIGRALDATFVLENKIIRFHKKALFHELLESASDAGENRVRMVDAAASYAKKGEKTIQQRKKACMDELIGWVKEASGQEGWMAGKIKLQPSNEEERIAQLIKDACMKELLEWSKEAGEQGGWMIEKCLRLPSNKDEEIAQWQKRACLKELLEWANEAAEQGGWMVEESHSQPPSSEEACLGELLEWAKEKAEQSRWAVEECHPLESNDDEIRKAAHLQKRVCLNELLEFANEASEQGGWMLEETVSLEVLSKTLTLCSFETKQSSDP